MQLKNGMTLYNFNDLSKTAQQSAIDWYIRNYPDGWADDIIEDSTGLAACLGLRIDGYITFNLDIWQLYYEATCLPTLNWQVRVAIRYHDTDLLIRDSELGYFLRSWKSILNDFHSSLQQDTQIICTKDGTVYTEILPRNSQLLAEHLIALFDSYVLKRLKDEWDSLPEDWAKQFLSGKDWWYTEIGIYVNNV